MVYGNNMFGGYSGYPAPTNPNGFGNYNSFQNQNMMNQNMYNPYQQPQQQQSVNTLVRVTGMDGAKAYQMGANSAVVLFDENEPVFYIKSTDGAGFPTITPYTFVEMTGTTVENTNNDFVSRSEFDEMAKEVERLKGLLENA